MFLLNDKPLGIDTPFEADGIQYPSNWLRLATAEEKAAIGIMEVPDAPSYDDRFYWGVGIPKQLDDLEVTPEDGQPYVQKGLKSQWIAQVKATAASLLAPTDWKIVRQAEIGTAIDADTLAYRAAVRVASNNFEVDIRNCQTVEDLAALQFAWPELP